ncbi:MAG: hypothetical protein ACM3YM_04100 [Sphingomonadales bacterium]
MGLLDGRVAMVTGATRGVRKGVALALAEAGATVYATDRSAGVETFGGDSRIIPLACDHTGTTPRWRVPSGAWQTNAAASTCS